MPRPRGAIAKCRCKADELFNTQFVMQKWLDTYDLKEHRWCAVERFPERIIKERDSVAWKGGLTARDEAMSHRLEGIHWLQERLGAANDGTASTTS